MHLQVMNTKIHNFPLGGPGCPRLPCVSSGAGAHVSVHAPIFGPFIHGPKVSVVFNIIIYVPIPFWIQRFTCGRLAPALISSNAVRAENMHDPFVIKGNMR